MEWNWIYAASPHFPLAVLNAALLRISLTLLLPDCNPHPVGLVRRVFLYFIPKGVEHKN